MGEHVSNVEFKLHGMGVIFQGSTIRLHFGDENIDETHGITRANMRLLMVDRVDGNDSGFANRFGAWIDNKGTTAAIALKTEFIDAAWAAL